MLYPVKTCCVVIPIFTSAVDVQELQVQPGPSEDQQRESAERRKRIESQANEPGAANAERTQ
ncbi:MAG: hypothetical protein ABFS24_11165 [Pseudomonadota bacterium]